MFARNFPGLPVRSVHSILWSSMLAATMFVGCRADAPASVVVVVQDVDGNPVPNAELITGHGRTHTDRSGRATLARPSTGRGFISVRADGYAPFAFPSDNIDAAQVPLLPQGEPASFDASQEVDVAAAGQVRITMEPGALIDVNGSPVTGQAQVTVVPLDPNGPQQDMVPLPLIQVEGEDDPQPLQSLFMADISFWQNGAPLQLAPGRTATLEMVLPEAQQGAYETGTTIDGFWFDVEAGIWKKGTLGLVMPSTLKPGKKSWIAAVDHFTFWGPASAIWTPVAMGIIAPTHCVNVTTREQVIDPMTQMVTYELIGGIRIQAVGIGYAHGGVPSYTNWADPVHLGQACLEFKHLGTVELIPSHPASYKLKVDHDSLIVGLPQNNQDLKCTHGLQEHASCIATLYIDLTLCGNGTIQPGESCDDGNSNNLDGCTAKCKAPECGDGFLQPNDGEQCDDGNKTNGDGCNTTCTLPTCGDGIVDGPIEACDDGNPNNDDGCTTLCKYPYCGDGFVQMPEICDDGDGDNDDDCTTLCEAPYCGDGFVQVTFGAEQCDNGLANSNTGTCTTNCQNQICGDGLVGPNEQCDNGNQNGNDACTIQCKVPFCGDGFIQSGEQCDNGLANSNTGACKLSCQNQVCGDGFVGPAEQCDDANQNNSDACTETCKPPYCGDGFTQVGLGETCDDANQNNNDACTTLCKAPFCGDGFIQGGEQCDNGLANSNTGTCKLNCENKVCGDGYVGPGEQCDDGNQINNDDCTNTCTSANCGDGVIQPGSGEQCDDQNLNNDDGCTTLCLLPFCGDAFPQVNVNPAEQCDDGDQDDEDGCTQICKPPFCGDGITQTTGANTPVEGCDDGNLNNNDTCTTLCEAPFCGDGFAQSGEACDDGNNADGDGCEANCQLPPGQLLWTAAYNGSASGQDRGYGVAADANGNVVVTGLASVTGQGFNAWTRKYSANGAVLWTKTFDGAGSGDDIGYGAAFAPNGNIIIVGVHTVVNQGYDIWVQCYDSNGTEVWSDTHNNVATSGFDIGYDVAVDSNNNVFVVGTETVGGQSNIWLRKYDSGGVEQWTKTKVSSAGYTTNHASVAIAGNGDVVVTGYEADLMAMAPSDKLVYLRYDTTGTLLPGAQVFTGSYHAQSTAVTNTGDIVVTGYQSTANDDIWVAKYTNTGSLLWQATYAGAAGAADRGLSIAVDSNDNILVSGYTTVGGGEAANYWVRKYLPNGAVGWTQMYNAPSGGNDLAYGITSDGSGNVLVTGYVPQPAQSQNVWTMKFSP